MENKKITPVSDEEMATWPAHGVVKLERPFVDSRGSIKPLVDIMMKSATLIESKAGSLRANHYHKTDWHFCYIISGKIEYSHRPTGSNQKAETIIVKKGEMIFTPPMHDHGMKFPVDTVFVTLSRNPRDQASYEADVVRVDLIPSEGLISWAPESGDK